MEIVGDDPLRPEAPGFFDQEITMTPGSVEIQASPEGANFTVQTGTGPLTRIWYLLSNPFVYLFTGRWRL